MSLFSDPAEICSGMWLLPGFATAAELKPVIDNIATRSPMRHMETMRGFKMSVAMTNCGDVGWVSDRRGYRYDPVDPLTGQAWPEMPEAFLKLSSQAASQCGYADFVPDVCLINRYTPGSQMGAHQDRNEKNFQHPIVSVSLGLPARFFVQGAERKGPSIPVDLQDGDVLVFGGESRLHYHGVRKLKPGSHVVFGEARWNLTFRVAQ